MCSHKNLFWIPTWKSVLNDPENIYLILQNEINKLLRLVVQNDTQKRSTVTTKCQQTENKLRIPSFFLDM